MRNTCQIAQTLSPVTPPAFNQASKLGRRESFVDSLSKHQSPKGAGENLVISPHPRPGSVSRCTFQQSSTRAPAAQSLCAETSRKSRLPSGPRVGQLSPQDRMKIPTDAKPRHLPEVQAARQLRPLRLSCPHFLTNWAPKNQGPTPCFRTFAVGGAFSTWAAFCGGCALEAAAGVVLDERQGWVRDALR